MTTTRFDEIVGADLGSAEDADCFSSFLRRNWIRVADTYDPLALISVIALHAEFLDMYIHRVGPPVHVLRHWWSFLVIWHKLSGVSVPATYSGSSWTAEMRIQVDALESATWSDLQDRIEELISAWEVISREPV